jgi:hypothetical protein
MDILLAVGVGALSIIMAVVGGILATKKKTLRASFIVMGLLSVVLVFFQADRAAKSQTKLEDSVQQVQRAQSDFRKAQADLQNAQVDLSKAQTELRDVATGGDAFPYLWVLGFVNEEGAPGNASIIIKNKDAKHSLYSISVLILFAKQGENCCGNFANTHISTIPEIAAGAEYKIPFDFSFTDSVYAYELDFTERNGSFQSIVEWKDRKWVVTTTRNDTHAVVDQHVDSAGYPVHRPSAQ